ncbi:hypothetical protein GCM10008171_19540 [Methylopila jiangsuensis]|uniref:Uncharacterized protein n=1 Tax=Methylopila jiangsuensis TaxID=586230 RepID=A0A9W6JJ01_9HYPH|nr:hypothetical protein GCM10008171_19540 [Methylopila jiangsuensis]
MSGYYVLHLASVGMDGKISPLPDMKFVTKSDALSYLKNLVRFSSATVFIENEGVFQVNQGGGDITRYSFGWGERESVYAEEWGIELAGAEVRDALSPSDRSAG